ncbi:hydroxyacid dehydrogenase [Streptomyces formicae]|uniref:Hydroxyacid dehydrogenase n=1 Tax=Streptomyces formicae TaxID=1616117 RepID=A0ABY3WLD0_9ACTN|nr:hydroxyacid dehydrogenase [Streptomyces formicae]UNM12142.1 hydroxyacid dehydrogenase [Streptomyces formicae]
MAEETRAAVLDDHALLRLRSTADLDPALLVTDFAAPGPQAVAALREAEVLLTGWGCPPITEEALVLMPALRAVVHAAGSVKALVTEAVWDRGISVTTAAEANARPVAEYTVAAIVFAGKRVLTASHMYRDTRAQLDPLRLFPAVGNYRTTVGVIGASRTGRRVIELLRAYDVNVLVYDPYLASRAATGLGAEKSTLDELVRRSDVVTIHAPELPETRHLLDAARLGRMRDGATLINTSRGSLVDTEALTAELVSGRLYAVLDVTQPDVLPPCSPLYDLPNVLLTPHIAGSLGNELGRLADTVIDELTRYARGRPFHYAVHPATLARSA